MVEQSNHFGQMVRHLQKLKRQLEGEGVTAVLVKPGGSRVVLKVPGLGNVTCRSNPADAHHLWYWLTNNTLTAAGDAEQVREAATRIIALLAEAPASEPAPTGTSQQTRSASSRRASGAH